MKADWLSYFLNPFIHEVRDHGRHGRVEAYHVQHAAVVRVGEGEAVGGHAHHDGLRVRHELVPIQAQGLRRVNVARPCLAVRVGDEARLFCLLRGGQHRQRTEPLHRNCKGHAAIAKKYVACPRPSDRYLSMIWCQVLGYAVTSARGEPASVSPHY